MCSSGSKSALRHSVRIVALCSLFIGIGISGLSSWILHKSIQMKKNYYMSSTEFLSQVNPFFGSSGPFNYNYEAIFRILIANSATALAGGALQLLFSLTLFLATIQGGRWGRFMGKLWVYVHVVVMLMIGSATLCVLTNELQLDGPIQIFVITTGIDALLIIFFMWIVYSWAFADEDDDNSSAAKNTGAAHVYHSPPGYTTTVATAPNNNGKGVENFKDVKLRPVSVV